MKNHFGVVIGIAMLGVAGFVVYQVRGGFRTDVRGALPINSNCTNQYGYGTANAVFEKEFIFGELAWSDDKKRDETKYAAELNCTNDLTIPVPPCSGPYDLCSDIGLNIISTYTMTGLPLLIDDTMPGKEIWEVSGTCVKMRECGKPTTGIIPAPTPKPIPASAPSSLPKQSYCCSKDAPTTCIPKPSDKPFADICFIDYGPPQKGIPATSNYDYCVTECGKL